MNPRPQRNPTLVIVGALLGLLALAVLMEARKAGEGDEQRRIERNRRLELEEQLETRNAQLNGALEKITEIKGGQPGSNGE